MDKKFPKDSLYVYKYEWYKNIGMHHKIVLFILFSSYCNNRNDDISISIFLLIL